MPLKINGKTITQVKLVNGGVSKNINELKVGTNSVFTFTKSVSFKASPSTYGSVNIASLIVPYNSTITVSDNKVVINGKTITATPTTETDEYTYTFNSWADAIDKITDDRIITANFTRTKLKYTVNISRNNTEYGTISHGSVEKVPYGTLITTSGRTVNINGTTVTASPSSPTKAYSYVFNNWTNGTATTGVDTKVTANFIRNIMSYNITFKNYAGTIVSDQTVDYDSKPTTPTNTSSTPKYSYSWGTISAVTGAKEYQEIRSLRSYSITWKGNGGTPETKTGTYDYDTDIASYFPHVSRSNYTHNGWSPALTFPYKVSGTQTFTAQWLQKLLAPDNAGIFNEGYRVICYIRNLNSVQVTAYISDPFINTQVTIGAGAIYTWYGAPNKYLYAYSISVYFNRTGYGPSESISMTGYYSGGSGGK